MIMPDNKGFHQYIFRRANSIILDTAYFAIILKKKKIKINAASDNIFKTSKLFKMYAVNESKNPY